jgi:Ca2+-binding EF-hand superfamily protein
MEKVVNFNKLRLRYQSKDIEILKAYLCEIFSDISIKQKTPPAKPGTTNQEKQVCKNSFINFIGLPYIIGERIFTHLAKGDKKSIKRKDFVEGLTTLYNGDLAETQEILFKILDFDNDGYIVAPDLRLFISFLYYKNEEQTRTQYDINKIIDEFFVNNKRINFKLFIQIVEKSCSDVFLLLTCFLYEHKFYDNKLLEIFNTDKDVIDGVLLDYYTTSNKKPRKSELRGELVSPKYIPSMFGIQTDFKYFLRGETTTDVQMEDELRELEDCEIGEIALENFITKPTINFIDYKIEYRKRFSEPCVRKKSSRSICVSYKNSFASDSKDSKSTKASLDINYDDNLLPSEGDIENYVYDLSKGKKKFWLVLSGKNIFYFKKKDKLVLKGLHHLSSSFLNDKITEVYRDNIKFYSFSIIFPGKERIFGFKSLEQCKAWLSNLKTNMNHRCIDEYFKQKEVIGKGGFGVVRRGTCKQTGQHVAIKIINKSDYKGQIYLIKNELEILKFCKHINIVQYIDSFETPEHIYIVTEYLNGGDLLGYLVDNNFRLGESSVKHIVKQIALGIEYLHYYGITHRDLKPMNILVSDLGNYPTVKIIDFGLSKVSGYNVFSNEGFGTMHFSAPELIQRKSYNNKIDLWSLGVLTYFLLIGELPFDDPLRSEKVVINKVLCGEYVMPGCIKFDVQNLISCCLEKDFNKRINIKDFLKHFWLNK